MDDDDIKSLRCSMHNMEFELNSVKQAIEYYADKFTASTEAKTGFNAEELAIIQSALSRRINTESFAGSSKWVHLSDKVSGLMSKY